MADTTGTADMAGMTGGREIMPPRQTRLEQFRAAYFGSIGNALITLGGVAVFIYIGWNLLHWAFLDAVFSAANGRRPARTRKGRAGRSSPRAGA